MITKTKMFRTLLTIAFTASCVLIASLSFAQETPPAPGTIIDHSNYKKYSNYFPKEWAGAFKDGFEGLLPVFKMKVVATKHYLMPKQFLEYSAKNKGKYSINAKGIIAPAFNREGLPFPNLKPGDKDFVTKLMWNYDSRYWCDDALDKGDGGSYEKRRGEPVRHNNASSFWLFFTNRMVESPKPNLTPNPLGLYEVFFFHYLEPESVRNTITVSYRYIDENKPDTTYVYLPSMRRVIRAEASQRSTPLVGTTQALDDFVVFNGRIPDFTYKLVRMQKVLAVPNSNLSVKEARAAYKKNELPVDTDGYQLRECYVIDITPKDPRYPQSRKRIWVDKETLWPYYGVAWDRAGKLWKVWLQATHSYPMPEGQQTIYTKDMIGIDLQFGEATQYVSDNVVNSNHFTYNDVTPQALLRAGE